jgi:hypothetical protein
MPPKNGNAPAEVASVPEEVTGQPRRVVLGHLLWRHTFVMGIWALVFGGMMPLGGLEASTLSTYLGIRWAVATGALVCALTALVTWLNIRQHQKEPAAT